MSHADRPPSRLKGAPWWAMVLALVAVVLVAGWRTTSSLTGSDDTAEAASAKGASGLSTGVRTWNDMGRVRGLTDSSGAKLQASARELSDDGDVEEATLALAWQATCGVVLDDVRLELGAVSQLVLELSAEFGVTFLEEGERVVANAVLDAIRDNANDAAVKCSELRNAGF